MAKTLGLDIVIGAAIVGAVNGFKNVLGGIDTLGSAIEKLNKEKLSILETIPEVKNFTDRLSTLNKTLDNLYKRKKDLQLKKLTKTDAEAKKLMKNINKKNLALSTYNFNIKDDLVKNKKTNLEFRALNSIYGLAKITASAVQRGIVKDKLIDFTKVVAKMPITFGI